MGKGSKGIIGLRDIPVRPMTQILRKRKCPANDPKSFQTASKQATEQRSDRSKQAIYFKIVSTHSGKPL